MPGVLSKDLGYGLLAGAGIAAVSFLSAYYVFKAHEKAEAKSAAVANAPAAPAQSSVTAAAAPTATAAAPSQSPVTIPATNYGSMTLPSSAGLYGHTLAPPALSRADSNPLSPMGSSLLAPPSTPSAFGALGTSAGLPASGDPAVVQLRSEIAAMAAERDKLQRLLRLSEASNLEVVPKAGAVPGMSLMSPSEIETLRGIFNLFDVKQEGRISVGELKALHTKLGEPLSDAEAAAAVKNLDRDGSGVVTFDKFLLWWYENHKMTGKKGDAYTARFKLLSAKLHSDGKEKFELSRVVIKPAGDVGSTDYRLNFYYKQNNGSLRPISVWHDVPLHALGSGANAQIYNFVCEIPKYTRAKFEIATGEPFNPIKQDIKHGKLRFQKYGDYFVVRRAAVLLGLRHFVAN